MLHNYNSEKKGWVSGMGLTSTILTQSARSDYSFSFIERLINRHYIHSWPTKDLTEFSEITPNNRHYAIISSLERFQHIAVYWSNVRC